MKDSERIIPFIECDLNEMRLAASRMPNWHISRWENASRDQLLDLFKQANITGIRQDFEGKIFPAR